MYTKKQRILAFLMCVVIVLVSLFSFFFIAVGFDHDCSGTDCPICVQINNAKKIIKQLSLGKAPLVFLICAASIYFIVYLECSALLVESKTLINDKVRLNN